VSDGHDVLVEQGAALGSGFSDDAYRSVGAEIAPSAEAVWSKAELILKVKEPIEPEWSRIRRGQVVFTYFHFAASEALTKRSSSPAASRSRTRRSSCRTRNCRY